MDVKPESWRRQPQSHAGEDGTSNIAWRRSGGDSSLDRPPRAARPHSCIEGRLKDEWLRALNNPQTCLFQQKRRNETTPSLSPSLGGSSRSSLESLYSGLESKERVQIKTGQSTERAKVCCIAPVRIGWLPLQRHVVRMERQNNADQREDTTCKVKLKPPITPVLNCASVKANGSETGDRTFSGLRDRGMSGAVSVQADSKRKPTLAERDQDSALDRATSVRSTSPHDRFLWQTPVPRRGSVPQVSLVGGRTSPKHSSSISSITITSRKVSRSSSLPDTSIEPDQDRDREPSAMALDTTDYARCQKQVIPRRKALIVKITEQRVQTSRFLPPEANNGPVYSCPSSRNTAESYFSRWSTSRSSDLSLSNHSGIKKQPFLASLSATGRVKYIPEITEMTRTESHSQVPSRIDTREIQMPVVLRRKPTFIKVQEQKDTFSNEDENQRRKVAYRHSFSGTDMKPQLDFEDVQEQVLRSKTKLYKSTVSLQLTSTNGSQLDVPQSSRGPQPRRPVSCYGSLFSPVGTSAHGSAVHSTISVLPQATKVTPECSAASGSNRCWRTEEGAGSHDEIYPRTESPASDEWRSKRESALQRNQPLMLIKVPEGSTHQTHDAVVALNAAAIIANIKLQSEQKKRTEADGNTSGEGDSTSLCNTAGARADKANIADEKVTAPRPVKTETADNVLSQSHTLRKSLDQRTDSIRHIQADERQHLLNTHSQQDYGQHLLRDREKLLDPVLNRVKD